MVRVISVHHFTSQDIQTCEDPVSVSAAPPNRLLVALANHIVQVRDLTRWGRVEFTFPTVDRVQHIQHCRAGNYVATLECGRHSSLSNFARIYVNWEAPTHLPPNEMAVVRARIAGRVTPSSQQCSLGVVEMIELPVKLPPVAIACCQQDASVLLSSGKSLTIFRYCVRTHDISRHKFVDFQESILSLELSFVPSRLQLCQDLVACYSPTHILLFELQKAVSTPSEITPSPLPFDATEKKSVSEVIDWDILVQSKDVADCAQFNQLDQSSFPLVVELPTVAKEKITEAHRDPFISCASDVTVTDKSFGRSGIKFTNLLQLKISQGDCSTHEEFRCMLTQPFYVKQIGDQNTEESSGVICIVATQQEGYLYHFPELNSTENKEQGDSRQAVVSVYPFTAPVSSIVLEHTLLHALTDTGVETYTTRCGHRLIATHEPRDYTNMVCPSESQPVCLVGLRPFLGVKHLVLCDSHLILLASSEAANAASRDGNWTLYSLCLPSATAVYNDIMSVAKTHQWTSPSVYYHLLSEAHVIVRTARCLGQRVEELETAFAESCTLLGDFYLSVEPEGSRMALPYYKMSGCTPLDVINRLTKKQRGDKDKNAMYSRGLVNYLKTCLQQMNTAPDELLFTPAVPSFINRTLDLYEVSAMDQVSSLVLSSKLVREYATDRVLAIMKDQLKAGPTPEPEHALALALLCIQKNFPSQALSVLNSLSGETLTLLLANNHHLLLEVSRDKRRMKESLAFTELATILFDSKPGILAQVLFKLVVAEEKSYTLEQILNVFMELLPRMTNTCVLQCFLERYFAWYFHQHHDDAGDEMTDEALKILVRSYLSDLQRSPVPGRLSNVVVKSKEEASGVLFEECRPKYLSKMDPYLTPNPHDSADTDVYKLPDNRERDINSLYKLQSLLSSGKLSADCMSETHQFVKTHSRTRGHLSLLVLCSPTKAAATILLNFCPDALLAFCQEKFESDKEWRWIIIKLQQKIQSMDDDNFLKENCIQILTNVLTHLSKTLSLEALLPMLPPGEKSIQSYIRTCQEMSHASHINNLLVATGHQLLNTLNL